MQSYAQIARDLRLQVYTPDLIPKLASTSEMRYNTATA